MAEAANRAAAMRIVMRRSMAKGIKVPVVGAGFLLNLMTGVKKC